MAMSKNASTIIIPGEIWNDEKVDLTRAIATGVTAPAWTVIPGSVTGGWGFANSQSDELSFNCQISHKVKPGSILKPHLHWVPSTTNNNNVRWNLIWNGALIDGAFTTDGTDPVTAPTGGLVKHYITTFTDISGFSVPSTILTFKLQRLGNDPADSFTGVAIALSFDVHYLSDRDGTTTVIPPWDT